MNRTMHSECMSPRAIETNIITQDGLRAYDLEPQSPELLTVAGPSGVDCCELDFLDLPAGFRRIDVDEWEELHNQS
jgi:hypothetical protein